MTVANRNKESKKGAGAAGAGGGTLLVVIANSLPDGNKLKPFLIWAAPSAAVFLGGLWLFVQFKIMNYLRDREARVDFENAKAVLLEALHNPVTSVEHRARLQKNLETLESITVGRYMDRIKALADIPEDGLSQLSELSKNQV